jgi:hypothetical protein
MPTSRMHAEEATRSLTPTEAASGPAGAHLWAGSGADGACG